MFSHKYNKIIPKSTTSVQLFSAIFTADNKDFLPSMRSFSPATRGQGICLAVAVTATQYEQVIPKPLRFASLLRSSRGRNPDTLLS